MIEKICSDLSYGRLTRFDSGPTRVTAKRAFHVAGVIGRERFLVDGLEHSDRRVFRALSQKVGPTGSLGTQTRGQVGRKSLLDRLKRPSHEVRVQRRSIRLRKPHKEGLGL